MVLQASNFILWGMLREYPPPPKRGGYMAFTTALHLTTLLKVIQPQTSPLFRSPHPLFLQTKKPDAETPCHTAPFYRNSVPNTPPCTRPAAVERCDHRSRQCTSGPPDPHAHAVGLSTILDPHPPPVCWRKGWGVGALLAHSPAPSVPLTQAEECKT